jgi:hypothetical protein
MTRLVCVALLFLLFAGATARADEGGLKLEAQLVLGSNETPPKGRPVSPEIAKKLLRLPLKWQHYSVVNMQQFHVLKDAPKTVSLSDACQISIKNLGESRVEVTLTGNGQDIVKISQTLKKGQTLVTGGNADNTFVVLRQVD